jgi:GR25 family glycosyltransferase involved in LPS biosynthesis
MVENNYEYGVIMEDNMMFLGNVPERVNTYIQQLNDIYPEWDILFDNSNGKCTEYDVVCDRYVYPKSNEITHEGHGGTRCAQFYLINKKSAKKLFDNFLPFNHAPDWYMNDLFRKLSIKSFWADPPNVGIWHHTSTAN